MKIKEKFISTPEHRILFTSDLHYGHANVIKHSNRPFANLGEMDSWILGELTTKIGPNDFLFDLGDMFWSCSSQQICDILDQIPTKNIYKVVGNHDRYGIYYGSGGLEVKKRFRIISDILDIQIESERTGKTYMVTMSHYPMVTWNHKHYGSIMLHGHCHSGLDSYNDSTPDLRVDLGMDAGLAKSLGGSAVIDFEDIIEFFDQKTGGLDYMKWTNLKCKEL